MKRFPAFAAAVLLAGLMTACGQPQTTLPTQPHAPDFMGVEIVGPDSLSPGQTAQYSVNVRVADGTVKGIGTSAVRWRSNNLLAVPITATGFVTAGQTNEAIISADVTMGRTTRTTSRSVFVMPSGTFRVVGSVREIESPFSPIPGARVEVATGTPFTTTDSTGSYKLYGVPAASTIHVLADGYTDDSRTVQLTANSTQDFRLSSNGQRLVLSGNYTLTVDTLNCDAFGAPLRSDLTHRSYDAAVVPSGSNLLVKLTEPRFRLSSFGQGNNFGGKALAGGAKFFLSWWDTYYYFYYGPTFPDVAEALSDGSTLVIAGEVVASGSGAGVSGVMQGSAVQWDSNFPRFNARVLSSCYGTLQFRLTPR